MSSARDMFPHFSDQQFEIAERLRQTFGDNMAVCMLREAGSIEAQAALLHAFASHGADQVTQMQNHAAVLQSQLEHGIAEMQNLSDISNQLKHENDSLRRQAPERPRPVKLSVPKFEGKESENLLRWLLQVTKGADALQISSERVRVDYALSFLSGRAEDWALTRCMTEPNCFPDFNTFVTALQGMFMPPNSDFRARANLLACKQGSRPLHAFISEMRFLRASLTDSMPESTMVTVFMRGIKQGPARTQLFRVFPQTLEAAFQVAQTEEYSQSMARGYSPSGPADGSDMDVSNVEARDMSTTKCYNCGRLGHMSRACPSPRQDNAHARPQRDQYGRARRGGGRGTSFVQHGRQGNAKSQ
jgi:hypothetical protein